VKFVALEKVDCSNLLIGAEYVKCNGVFVALPTILIFLSGLMCGCKFSNSAAAEKQNDSSLAAKVHPAELPLVWDTSFGAGDTVIWAHAATNSFETVARRSRFARFNQLLESVTSPKGWHLKQFANLNIGQPKDCKRIYYQAPISAVFHDSFLVVEIIDPIYDSVHLESVPGHMKISLGKPNTHCAIFSGEACLGKTVILVKQKGLQRVSGASSDGAVGFDFVVSGDSLISASKNGEWHCFSL